MYLAQTEQFFDASQIALAALIVAPLVSIVIARMQIRAQLVSSNRLKWIEELRSHIADYASEAIVYAAQLPLGRYGVDRVVALGRLTCLIKLFLDPFEESHTRTIDAIAKLDALLHEVSKTARKKGPSGDEVYPDITGETAEVSNAAHELLLSEWKRVKRGE